jgi:predicted ATP-dependent serine protease
VREGGQTLVSRGKELARIERALDGLGPLMGIVEIAGEPGIGKSSLLAELCKRADARKQLVLQGRAVEFEQTVPSPRSWTPSTITWPR